MSKNKKFDLTMFAKLKDSLAKAPTSSSFANIMKFPQGHTYTLRLIPNLEDIDKTFFAHQVHQWNSLADGSFVSVLSLQTFGEKDPIAALRWKLYKEWKDSKPAKDAKFEGVIQSKQQWFVNVYVIDDPANPDNNGTVKVLKMGPQLKDIIDDAMTGERADEFGAVIFDLSKDGADFKIVADKQGEFTTFKKSYFTNKTKFDLNDDEVEALYEQIHDLNAIIPVKTEDELKQLLQDHYYCGEAPVEKEEKKEVVRPKPAVRATPSVVEPEPVFSDVEDDSDDIPFTFESDPDGIPDGIPKDIQDLIDGLDK